MVWGFFFVVGFGFFFPSRGCKQLEKIDIFKKTILPWRWIKVQNVCLVPKNVILSVRVKIFWLEGNPASPACFERVTFCRRCCAVLSCMAVGKLRTEHKNRMYLKPFCHLFTSKVVLLGFLLVSFPHDEKNAEGSTAEGTCFWRSCFRWLGVLAGCLMPCFIRGKTR